MGKGSPEFREVRREVWRVCKEMAAGGERDGASS
jgi:hypothetical protein